MNLKHDESGKFTTDRDEPLLKNLNIRISASMYGRIKSVPNANEKIRVLLQNWLDSLEQPTDNGEK